VDPQNYKIPENWIDLAIKFCQDIITHLGMDLRLETTVENDTVTINLTGSDRHFLLSNSASLLNSIEYLVNRAFRIGKDERPSVVLDSDNYWQHREAELVLLAQMASKKVISLRKPLSLQPMTPRERRIVHLALADIEGVNSRSDGEGESRCITIYPA
jgi:spoIIIJ-associated protein